MQLEAYEIYKEWCKLLEEEGHMRVNTHRPAPQKGSGAGASGSDTVSDERSAAQEGNTCGAVDGREAGGREAGGHYARWGEPAQPNLGPDAGLHLPRRTM